MFETLFGLVFSSLLGFAASLVYTVGRMLFLPLPKEVSQISSLRELLGLVAFPLLLAWLTFPWHDVSHVIPIATGYAAGVLAYVLCWIHFWRRVLAGLPKGLA